MKTYSNLKPYAFAIFISLVVKIHAQTIILAEWDMNNPNPMSPNTLNNCIIGEDLHHTQGSNISSQAGASGVSGDTSICFGTWGETLNWEKGVFFDIGFAAPLVSGYISSLSFDIRNYSEEGPSSYGIRVYKNGVKAAQFISSTPRIGTTWSNQEVLTIFDTNSGSGTSVFVESTSQPFAFNAADEYSFQISAFDLGDGTSGDVGSTRIALDNVKIIGDVNKAPEPSSSVLIMLGAILINLRRQR